MVDERVQQFRAELEKLDTEDLVAMWCEKDRAECRDEVFTAIEEILKQRGIEPPQQKSPKRQESHGAEASSVVVTDIRMPFWSMVVFMVKWGLAAIPALIILWIVAALIMMVLEKPLNAFLPF